MNYFLYICAAIVLSGCTSNISQDTPQRLAFSHYDIQLSIDPDKQFIQVRGELKYLVTENKSEKITFKLHKQLKLSHFSVNGDTSYYQNFNSKNPRWTPDALEIVYPTKARHKPGDVLKVNFAYQGTLSEWPDWSANVIGTDWVEIGMYFPWYPSVSGKFTYHLSVAITPGYKVFTAGKASTNGNLHVFESQSAVYDLVVCAAKDLKLRKTTLLGREFTVANAHLSDSAIDSIQNDVGTFYRLYQDWFGDIAHDNMSLVISKREKGGGYSRKNALYLGGLTNENYSTKRTEYNQYIAHEIAHFWWKNAPANSWEDWLNESFSEYAALKVIENTEGTEAFNSRLALKRGESSNIPPIWHLARNSPHAQAVLYSKGAVLLYQLESRIGSPAFFALCREMIKQRTHTTEEFLTLLKDSAGENVANWFEYSLKTN
ncbi:Aminopeptidase N [Alteromonadaceae bacterium Bs31]|nr:Aminopeptidase N [Alteromonadaceae bacterium Bs31]